MSDVDHQIYLASRSPRRGELLSQIGVRFAVEVAETDETPHVGESPEDYVRRVALDKALCVKARLPEHERRPVLAADTAVILDDATLGKPEDAADAARMLRALSGRIHRVLTAVAVIGPDRQLVAVSESLVTFRDLGDGEIVRYCRTGEPLDKAGSYGIQGLGALFVARLEGSYSGVMGLPLFETGQLLEQSGVPMLAPVGAD